METLYYEDLPQGELLMTKSLTGEIIVRLNSLVLYKGDNIAKACVAYNKEFNK